MTSAYTYEVKMIIEVLAESKELADVSLDEKGGHVSKRTVTLLGETPLLHSITADDAKDKEELSDE